MVKKYTPYISYTKDGKPVANQKYVDPLRSVPGKLHLRKVQITMKKNTAQARKLAFDKLSKRIDRRVGEKNNSDITFHQLIDKYQDFSNASDAAWATKAARSYTLDRLKRSFDENVIADKISPTVIMEYLENLLYHKQPKPLSNSTVRSYKATLSNIFEFGVNRGLVTSNPTKGLKINWKNEAAKRRNEIENKYLTDKELNAVLDFFKNVRHRQDYYLLFKVMSSTGLRYSEAAGLKKKNLIYIKDKWFLRVEGKLEYRYGEYSKKMKEKPKTIKSSRTKTIGSYRDVLIPDSLAFEIKENAPTYSDFLFINSMKKTTFNYMAVDHYLHKCEKRLKLSKKLTTHIFRHTYISNLASHDIPLNVIMKQVGHQDSEVTTQIYTHVTDKQIDKFHESLNNLFDD